MALLPSPSSAPASTTAHRRTPLVSEPSRKPQPCARANNSRKRASPTGVVTVGACAPSSVKRTLGDRLPRILLPSSPLSAAPNAGFGAAALSVTAAALAMSQVPRALLDGLMLGAASR